MNIRYLSLHLFLHGGRHAKRDTLATGDLQLLTSARVPADASLGYLLLEGTEVSQTDFLTRIQYLTLHKISQGTNHLPNVLLGHTSGILEHLHQISLADYLQDNIVALQPHNDERGVTQLQKQKRLRVSWLLGLQR